MLFQTIDTGTGRPLPVDKIVYNDQGSNPDHYTQRGAGLGTRDYARTEMAIAWQ